MRDKIMHICKCNICGAEFEDTDSRRRYCTEHRDKNTQQYYRNQKNKQKTHPDAKGVKAKPETVVCTGKVAKKCKYGSTCGETYCCDYLLITEHRRGCSWKECNKYQAGPKRMMLPGGQMVFK